MCPGTASTNKQGLPCVTVLFGGEACREAPADMIDASSSQIIVCCYWLIFCCVLEFCSQLCFLAATVNSPHKKQCRYIHIHVHKIWSIESLLQLYLSCVDLTTLIKADGLVLTAIPLLVAGADAVGTGQGICGGDTKACDMQASGQCSKQQRCQWLPPPLRHPWMADL